MAIVILPTAPTKNSSFERGYMEDQKIVYRTPAWGTMLAVLFVVLKLCKVIDWSWWIVFLPILIPLGLIILMLIILGLISLVE